MILSKNNTWYLSPDGKVATHIETGIDVTARTSNPIWSRLHDEEVVTYIETETTVTNEKRWICYYKSIPENMNLKELKRIRCRINASKFGGTELEKKLATAACETLDNLIQMVEENGRTTIARLHKEKSEVEKTLSVEKKKNEELHIKLEITKMKFILIAVINVVAAAIAAYFIFK